MLKDGGRTMMKKFQQQTQGWHYLLAPEQENFGSQLQHRWMS